MQLRPDQLAQHLERGPLRPIYTVHGDEALLAQEAGDLIRAAARDAGCSERQVFTVSGAHFDWSGVLGAAQAMSLFAERRLIEIRIPGGQAGQGWITSGRHRCHRSGYTCGRCSLACARRGLGETGRCTALRRHDA